MIINTYLTSTVLIEQISCQNEKGKITVQGTGGKGPYIYSINGGTYSSSNVFTDLVAGTHLINTKDTLGCKASISVVIGSYTPLEATYVMTNGSCNGSIDGSISINATGGTSPYVYSLDGGITYVSSNVFTNFAAGIYNIAIKDANGCFMTYTVTITEPTILLATVSINNQTITMNATGGNGTYDYSLEDFTYQVSNIFTNVSFGDHDVSVRDQNGCVMSVYITVSPQSPLINGKNTLTVKFTPGQTLGDIVVDGQDIKWYTNPNSSTSKTSKITETILSLTTVLVDGVTRIMLRKP
ncbi:MAG: SprB repeat-containing protein [Flavobacterium sp.]